MAEEFSPQLGINRRDLLRRGAIVSGSLVWAAPAVQSFARPALAQNGTPQPGEGAISYVALVLICGEEFVRVKYEVDTGWDASPGKTPGCEPPAGWEGATKAHGGDKGVTVTGDAARLCFTIPSGCRFHSGVAMGAGGTMHPSGKGFCVGGDVQSANEVCFSDPQN